MMSDNVVELHPKIILDSALKYASQGYRILPLHSIKGGICTCGNHSCKSPGKHPLTQRGANEASSDEIQIKGWWSQWPTANIGIAMGDHGTIALDVDTRNNGHLTWEAILQANGQLPETATQRTGNGWHYLFVIDEKLMPKIKGKLGQGIDVKANGYIVAEPSIHHSGRRYSWDDGLDLLQGFNPSRAPVWLEQMLCDSATSAPSTASLGNITLPVQLTEAASALEHLDANDYNQWIEAGMALHATGLGDLAYQVWVDWSVESPKFDHKDQRRRWMSFRTDKGGVSIKTIFARAQALGWVNPLSVKQPSITASASADFTVQQGSDFGDAFKAPEYVIDGILLRGYLHGLTGLSNAGKTAIGLSMAASVALGRSFGRHKAAKANVLFLAGENPEDIRLRVKGMEQLFFLHGAFNDITFAFARFDIAANMAHLQQLAVDRGGFGLVVVDSSAAFFNGDEENSNSQMVAHAMKLRKLTELEGRPAVMVLCHPSKYASGHEGLMPRGGSAFLNELDANLTAWKEGEIVQLGWNKVRGPAFDFIDIKLDVCTFDGLLTNLGSQVTSVVATAVDAKTTEQLQDIATSEENQLLLIMGNKARLSLREYAIELQWFTSTGDPYVGKVQRHLKDLKLEKLVRLYRKKWVLTEAGKKAKDTVKDVS
jgi:hypothetical protein